MKVNVLVKKIGRNSVPAKSTIMLSKVPLTLENLIEELVMIEVKRYNEKTIGESILPFITNEQIDNQIISGKVSFQTIYNDKKVDAYQAIEIALQAFQDGLIKVFINDSEIDSLQSKIELIDNCELVFMKLTMLSGRRW